MSSSKTGGPFTGLVATDFDGTLFCPDGRRGHPGGAGDGFCAANREALKILKKHRICRVVVTGRSLYSFEKAAGPLDLDIDFLIFSSGAGILGWKDKKMLRSCGLKSKDVEGIAGYLMNRGVDFMIQAPVPDNHRFLYWSPNGGSKDYHRRIEIYRDSAEPLNPQAPMGDATQFLAILPEGTPLKPYHEDLSRYSVIRATSPLDHKTIWLEIFPREVNKGIATEWLSSTLGLTKNHVLAVGNDTNDLDLLKWAGAAYTVTDAHGDLAKKYPAAGSCRDGGFSSAVALWLAEKSSG